jgi:sulfite reductase alpha subunit-like flavoprotein
LLLEKYPLPDGILPVSDGVLLEPNWSLHPQGKDPGHPSLAGLPRPVSSILGAVSATLIENTRLTPLSHWQDVRKLTLTVPKAQYTSGDVLIVFPRNFEDDVDQMIDLMSWKSIADVPLSFVSKFHQSIQPEHSGPARPEFPSPITIRVLLTNHLDITAIPRRSFFSSIAHFTNDTFQRDRLLEFTRPEYIDELYDYTTRPRRSILEVLQEFTSVKIPLKWICSVFPTLRGRQFSIASGGALKHPSAVRSSAEEETTIVELLIAIIKYRTIIKKIRQGVCTRYLASLAPGTTLPVLLQRGGLNITKEDLLRPVILIGPGTGVAPMRSLLWERLEWAQEHQTTPDASSSSFTSIGESILFFGCRSKDSDDFFVDEWKDLGAKMPLQVFKAYSRDQRQKVYVQDLIWQQAKLVTRVLREQNGLVYICGSSGKMPRAVREALIHAFESESEAGLPGLDRAAAEAYMTAMEKEGRYKQETW